MGKIRIIDKTITILFQIYNQKLRNNPEIVVEIAKLLSNVGVTYVEIPYELYCIASIPDYIRVKLYRSNEVEISRTDQIKEKLSNVHYSDFRIVGLDDLIIYNYAEKFKDIISQFGNHIEMCFKNKYDGATAMSYEWLKSGGETVVTTFSGIGSYAPLEELLSTIKFIDKSNIKGDLTEFVKLTSVMENIFDLEFDKKKPIIGDNIFSVESGVHVDGILKNPENFEPFDPLLVGRTRRFVIGKSSGSKSLQMKLNELNIQVEEQNINEILNQVRNLSSEKGRSLCDEEIYLLCEGVK